MKKQFNENIYMFGNKLWNIRCKMGHWLIQDR